MVFERTEERRCCRCGRVESEGLRLYQCSVCQRWFCRACAARRYGKEFCSVHCSDAFFYGDDDADPEEA